MMRKNKGKIAVIIMSAIFAFLGTAFATDMPVTKAEAATTRVNIDLSKITCTEFAEFSFYTDTHRTRLIMEENAVSWGVASINLNFADWLSHITVNGKSIADYKAEHEALGSPALQTEDPYIKSYNCAPISVTLGTDASIGANVIDLSIPECFIPAADMKEVGVTGTLTYVCAEDDNKATYTLSGAGTVANPNAVTPTYTVTVDGASQTVEKGALLARPQTPVKEETSTHTYQFIGWYFLNAEGEKVYWNFDVDTVVADVVLFSDFCAVEKTKYTVTFDPDNGEEPTRIQTYEGAKLTAEQMPAEPQKQGDEYAVFTFEYWSADGMVAWDFASNVITADVMLKAVYSMKKIYTVSFDGVAQRYEEGDYLIEPATPVKPSTAEYEYTFLGWYYMAAEQLTLWDFQTDRVTEDVALVPVYEEIKIIYTLSIYMEEGGDAVMKRLAWDEAIPYPTLAERDWYKFLGWVDAEGNTAPAVMPKYDLAVYANWELVEYVATVRNETETMREVKYTQKNATEALAELKNFLLQANDEKYTYSWQTALPNSLPAKDDVYYATTRKVSYKLTVCPDVENPEQVTELVLTWEEPISLQPPQAQRGRTFLGWSMENGEELPAVMPTRNLTVVGNWTWTVYTMTVQDGDGRAHQHKYTVKEADDRAYAQATFAQYLIPQDVKAYTYAWETPVPEYLPLENERVYKVKKTPIEYVLSFADTEITPITFTVESLSTLTLPTPPAKIGYTVTWDKTVAEIALEDTELTPVYTIIEYVLTFVGIEQAPITFTVETIASVKYPTIPRKEGYVGAWDKNISQLALENTTVTLRYTLIEYKITFISRNDTKVVAFTVETKDQLTFPEPPGEIGYEVAWDKTPEDIDFADTTVNALYTPIRYTITFAGVEGISPIVYTVEEISLVRMPELPEKEGYTAKWDQALSEIGLKDITVTAIYTPVLYTISFDVEGVAPIPFTVENKESIRLPATPERVGYTGAWNMSMAEIGLEDVTLSPVYTITTYTLSFQGTETPIAPITFTVETIGSIQIPELPVKNGYTGVWDKTAADIKPEDTVVTAVYTEIPPMEQVKDYGENIVRSCFGSISASSVLLPMAMGVWVVLRKKEE